MTLPSPAIHVTTLSRADQRSFVLHVLYSLEVQDEFNHSLDKVLRGYLENYNYYVEHSDAIYNEITMILSHKEEIDEQIKQQLQHWELSRLNIMVLLVLRYAMAEFLYTTQDSALIINEAIELAKSFAEKESYRLINGILDAWIKANNRK